jgi:hypothetical protein
MTENILEEHGLFWWRDDAVPTGCFAPENNQTGILRVTDDGRTTLDLSGMLTPGRHPLESMLSNERVLAETAAIQGILRGTTKHVLLTGLHKGGSHFSSNGISYEAFSASKCLVGHEAFPPHPEPIQAATVEVELKGFEDWLRLRLIEYSRTADNKVSAQFEPPANRRYAVVDGELELRYDIYAPPNVPYKLGSLEMRPVASLMLTPTVPIALDDAITRHLLFQDVLILLTDSDYAVDWPSVKLDASKPGYTLYFRRHKNSAQPPKATECWTKFSEIADSLGNFYSEWKTKREIFGPAFYLYLGTRRGLTLFVEHRFANMVWGLESLHRRRNLTVSGPSELLREKIARILERVTNKNDNKWLARKLRDAWEPSLENRLFDLFKCLPLDLDPMGLRTFSKDCARLRNDISHFGGLREQSEPEAYDKFVRQLSRRNDALSHLYHCLLLQEIGVADEISKRHTFEGPVSYPIKSGLTEFGLVHHEGKGSAARSA